MSAEVSFTKRAAAELSRCFNGLTVNRGTGGGGGVGSSGSASSKKSSSSSTTSGPSTSSSITSTSSASSSTSFFTESRQSSTSSANRPLSETTTLLPLNNNNPPSPSPSGRSKTTTSSKSSSHGIIMRDGITITNSVQSLINKANNTLSPFKESFKAASSSHRTSSSSSGIVAPSTPSRRPPPPPAPRKTSIARRKNFLLSLQKPTSLQDLFKDFSFIHNFFGYFNPKERTILAQVCSFWRDILYNDPHFWKGLVMVINCNDLRRLSPLPPSPSPTTSTAIHSSPIGSSSNSNNNHNLLNNNNNHIPNVSASRCIRRKSSPIEDSARHSLYLSIEQRGFRSICLYGATDADIIDFASKISPSVMRKITSGSLQSCSATDKGLEIFLAALNQSLLHLELTGCNEITDSGLWTALIPNLESLIITDCINIADETVASVTQVLSNLESLTLQAYHVTDSAMSYFGPTAARLNLRTLHLESCWEIGNQGILSIAHGLPNLSVLSLSGCSKVTDDAIEVIAEQLRHLTSLNLSWCARITDASLEYIACDLADTLKELILDRCVHVTDIGLGYAATMGKLTTLSLRWCPQVRDFGVQTLCSMKSLKSLSLAGCPQLTVSGLSCLTQMHQLSEIELTNCPGATVELIRFLTDHLPRSTVIIP